MGMSAPAKNLLMVCEANPSQTGLGRFLSRDALGSLNRYEYCYNNPINWVDVNGLEPQPPGYHMTTDSDGVNSYYNDASYHDRPNQIPPDWNMDTEDGGVHSYDNYPRPVPPPPIPPIPPIPPPKINYPKLKPLPKYKLDCPKLDEPLKVPKIRQPEWPPRDRFPRPNHPPLTPRDPRWNGPRTDPQVHRVRRGGMNLTLAGGATVLVGAGIATRAPIPGLVVIGIGVYAAWEGVNIWIGR